MGQNKIKKKKKGDVQVSVPMLQEVWVRFDLSSNIWPIPWFFVLTPDFAMADAKKPKKWKVAIGGIVFFPFKISHDALMLEKGKTLL